MELAKYHLKSSGKVEATIEGKTESVSCGNNQSSYCGRWCAMFELRQGQNQSSRPTGEWYAVLHCCKRAIKFEQEGK